MANLNRITATMLTQKAGVLTGGTGLRVRPVWMCG
jgi:hypothetical protein